jgi:hypothetical protein
VRAQRSEHRGPVGARADRVEGLGGGAHRLRTVGQDPTTL